MFSLIIEQGKGEVRMSDYGEKKEERSKEENCNITPLIYLSPRFDTS